MVALFAALMFIGFVLVDLIAQRLEARRAAVSAPAGLPWNVPQGFYLDVYRLCAGGSHCATPRG
jgi:hypothetical protein